MPHPTEPRLIIALGSRAGQTVMAGAVAFLLACSPAPPFDTRAADTRSVTVDQGAYDPAVSPDGSTIAMGLLGRIWLLPMEGGEARPLTSGYGWDHHPTWSPDGQQLAYVHDSPAGSELVLRSLVTGTSRTLYGRSPAHVTGGRSWGAAYSFGKLRFHPTNGRLYFVDFRSGIWSVDAQGPGNAAPELLLEGSGRLGRPGITELSGFAFSPDGDRIVVEKDTTGLWTQLHVTAVDTVDFSAVTSTGRVRHGGVEWGGDEGRLVYLERAGAREGLAIHDLVADDVRRLDLGPFNGREFTLHPHGDGAVVVSGRRLLSLDLSTGETTPIPFQATLSLPPRSDGHLVIINARLFDATGEEAVEGATVEIQDGVIVAVSRAVGATGPVDHAGEAEEEARASGTRVIDAGGRFLMPGLVDSHAHLSKIGMFSQAGVLALGITSVFDPGSYLPETLDLRDAISLGVLGGPHIHTSGPMVDGSEGRAIPFIVPDVNDAETARSLVRELAAQGVDAIKLYAFLEPEALAAAIAEAHEHGLPVVGDQVLTPWDVALDADIDGLVHVMDHKWQFLSPQGIDDPWGVVDPDSAMMDAFFARVASQGVMMDPTMMASSRFFDSDEFAAALQEGVGEPDGVHRARVLANMLRVMHGHGVHWVAGTDAGTSLLLDELAIYEAMGIPNHVILQTATANAARWLKRDDFGTVEAGKRADLILVDGNPLERVRDLEEVILVVQDGRVVVER
ncbi:MAG: amidohydrolase family protein [Gemmatimonadota bacterium]